MSNKKLEGVFWLGDGDSFANRLLFSLNAITNLTKDFPEVLEYKKFFTEATNQNDPQDIYGLVNRKFSKTEIKQYFKSIDQYCSEEEILEHLNNSGMITIGDEEEDDFTTVGEFFKEIKKKNSEYFDLFLGTILFLAVYIEDGRTKVSLYHSESDDIDE